MAEAVANPTVTNANQTVEEMIRAHAEKTLSLAGKDIEMSELAAKDLPAGARLFYVEQKNTAGKVRYTYLFWNNALYSSGVEADFGRFLKDYGFLAKQNLDANQLMNLYAKLKTLRNVFPIKAEDLSQPSGELKPFVNKISAPKLVADQDGGATFTFFTQTMNVIPVQKVAVKIAPDYKVEITREFVAAE